MIWQEILGVVAGIILSFGGASAIIVAISKWLGGIVANSIIQKNQTKYDKELEEIKTKYQKEIEEYKNQLNIACEEIKRKNTEVIYVTEKQFDIEIALIQELTEKAFALDMKTRALYPVGELAFLPKKGTQERKKYNLDIATAATSARNSFIQALGKSRVFIDESIYEKYCEFQRICGVQYVYFFEKEIDRQPYFDDEHKECCERTRQLAALNKEISAELKEYLQKLKVVNKKQETGQV